MVFYFLAKWIERATYNIAFYFPLLREQIKRRKKFFWPNTALHAIKTATERAGRMKCTIDTKIFKFPCEIPETLFKAFTTVCLVLQIPQSFLLSYFVFLARYSVCFALDCMLTTLEQVSSVDWTLLNFLNKRPTPSVNGSLIEWYYKPQYQFWPTFSVIQNSDFSVLCWSMNR